MADLVSRLPIQRGLVEERKARLLKIKEQNESPRGDSNIAGPESFPEDVEYRTAFGTPTTVRSSPRRSRTSFLHSYKANGSVTSLLRRKPSAVTISGPLPVTPKSHGLVPFRRPTPFAYPPSESDASTRRSQSGSSETGIKFEIHQPMPQSIRSSLACGLESRIGDVPPSLSLATSFEKSSRAPSDSDFARVLSHEAYDDDSPGEYEKQPETPLQKCESELTLRAASVVSKTDAATITTVDAGERVRTTSGGKREYIRKILKGRSNAHSEHISQLNEPKEKGKIRRIFSTKHARVISESPSDLSSSDEGDLAVEYTSSRLIIHKCNATHESVEVLNEKGTTAVILTVTDAG